MTCKLCAERPVPDNYGSERKCAFDEQGMFTPENWMCETMNELRRRVRIASGSINDDVLLIIDASSEGVSAWIALVIYKRRGRVESATLLSDGRSRSLTLEDAENALKKLTDGEL
jgi:hypothetical protein